MSPARKFGSQVQKAASALRKKLPGGKKQKGGGDKERAQDIAVKDPVETLSSSSPGPETSSDGTPDNKQEGSDTENAQDFTVLDPFIVQDPFTAQDPIDASPLSSRGSDIIISGNPPINILAFRTITKLLNRIQRDQEHRALQNELDKAQVVELKISDAFATVAVTEHEVVAVATNRRMHPDMLQVAVSIYTPHTERPMWTFAFNTRWSEEDPYAPQTAEPTITSVANLAAIDPDADMRLEELASKSGRLLTEDEKVWEYAQQHWSMLSASNHLWILSKLLCRKESTPWGLMADPDALTQCILPYTISSCHRKIYRRLKAATSLFHIKALDAIQGFVPNENLLMNNQPSEKELSSDRQFLLDYVLGGTTMHTLKIPELTKQAELARNNKPFQLYNEATCLEFHNVFKDILKRFKSGLQNLDVARSETDGPTPASPYVNRLIHTVVAFGYALQILSQSSGLQMHLQAISTLLLQQALAQQEDESAPTTQTEDDIDLEDELDSIQSSTESVAIEIPMWQRLFNWLKLIINHFDAIDILIKYVTSEHFTYNGISVQFMDLPPTGTHSLPWRDLFKKPDLFPTFTLPERDQKDRTKAKARAKPHANVNNAQILQFMEMAVKDVAVLGKVEAAWKADIVPNVISSFREMQASKLPGWAAIATTNITRLKGITDDTSPTDPVMDSISKDIDALRSSAFFFEELKDEGPMPFHGALHCEACIAAILSPSGNASEGLSTQLRGFGPIIGISKRSCPVCQELLLQLSGHPEEFIVRGSHNTVTACSLPPWLPSHIVNSMVQYFGGQLRQELVELMDRSQLIRKRNDSTGSHRLSADISGLKGLRVDFSKTVGLATNASNDGPDARPA